MEGHPRRALILINIARCVEAQAGREREALGIYEQAMAETNALAAGDASIRDARQIAEERIAELNARFEAIEESAEATAPTEIASSKEENPVDLVGPIPLLASGGAALLAGIGTGVATALEHGELATACPSKRCAEEDAGRIDTVRALGITTDVLLGVGAAAAAAGAVPRRGRSRRRPGRCGPVLSADSPLRPAARAPVDGPVCDHRWPHLLRRRVPHPGHGSLR